MVLSANAGESDTEVKRCETFDSSVYLTNKQRKTYGCCHNFFKNLPNQFFKFCLQLLVFVHLLQKTFNLTSVSFLKSCQACHPSQFNYFLLMAIEDLKVANCSQEGGKKMDSHFGLIVTICYCGYLMNHQIAD